MLRMTSDTIGRLDLRAAVESEVTKPGGTLPKRSIEAAMQSHMDEAAEYLGGVFRSGAQPAGADEIQAPKAGRGLRPLSVLGFPERILFEALTANARQTAPPLAREWNDWESFATAPLQDDDASHVVNADISAFYHYVDHELLETELVSQTGDASTAAAISSFLHGVMQRRYGLPQLYRGSDFLSELIIDKVERRLLRMGLPVWRFNDDFRIAVPSWKRAQEVIGILDREVRRVGLTLNEEKTWAQRAENYRQWLLEPERVWNEYQRKSAV